MPRRALIFALILALVFPGVCFAFSDLPGHWSEPLVQALVEGGVVSGYPDGTFRPDSSVTRAEFASLLSRALGIRPATGDVPGVPPGHWASGFFGALAEKGVINPADYPGGLDPDAGISRLEVAVWTVRASGLEDEAKRYSGEMTSVTDFSSLPQWAKGYVAASLGHRLMTGYPDGSFGPGRALSRAEACAVVSRVLDPSSRPALWREAHRLGSSSLQVVRVNLKSPSVDVRPVLAGKIGDVAYVGDMASASGAAAMINGTYFSAYGGEDYGEPFNSLCLDGRWLHLAYAGTTMGITRDKRILMAPIRMRFEGSIAGKPCMWGAFSLNHTAPDAISVFTPERGPTTRMKSGASVVVRNGYVVCVGGPDVEIPKDGFVVHFADKHASPETWDYRNLSKPGIGPVSYTVEFTDHHDRPYPRSYEWKGVVHAVGAGPRLVASGRVSCDPASEMLNEPKVTTLSGSRSAVGVTSDGVLVLATCPSATVYEIAGYMLALGCEDAMCLDGGASSSLWYKGSYLQRPGRKVSNALGVFIRG